MTDNTVMPPNAGIHVFLWPPLKSWMPAFAGMTPEVRLLHHSVA